VIPVGVSILTNGSRRKSLERCIDSLLANCYYRPLVIGILDNGSTDDTGAFLGFLPKYYGVEWRVRTMSSDKGCAMGTNESIDLVSDCEFQLHLESDFEHLTPEESGVDRLWMHRAVELLMSGDCDYLYLRRMRDHFESQMHWWSQWMPRITEKRDEWMRCPSFWWSNNPTLFRIKALAQSKTLPLNILKDGPKGTGNWSKPELEAPKPPNPWLHRWGMFIHERKPTERFVNSGCTQFGPFGHSGCKYGFWYPYGANFCLVCNHEKDIEDLPEHEERARGFHAPRKKVVAFHSNQLGYRGTEVGSWNYAKYNESILGNKSVFLAPHDEKNIAVDRFSRRFPTFIYETWEEAEAWLEEQSVDVLHMRKEGLNDGRVSKVCRTVVHCAFPRREEHGDVYCYISEWLSKKASGGELPWIPHIVEKPEPCEGLREELGIPESANVFGWIGGPETFNLPAGFDAVKALCNDGKTWFVFVGIPKFIDSPQVKFLPVTWDPERKRQFIFSCDAMLQARCEGETFGLAVAEFSAAGRPVVTWHQGIGMAHLEMLGDKAITYTGSHDLIPILRDWKHETGPEWDVYTDRFSPEKVMQIFKEVCGL